MPTETTLPSLSRQKLILHDTLAFATLVAITAALFTLTLLLFRSFETHRAELASRWSARGVAAFDANRPDESVAAYRTALTYARDRRGDELMLAQALARAGRTDEAYTYFLGLWETQPGNGFINLQLARLAATKRDTQAAINFYRASIYGTWEGDGVERRREGRLELARYLIAQHEPAAARAELLIAGGNAPDTAQTDFTLAQLLEQAEAAPDALAFYRKALAHNPNSLPALTAAARLTFAAGDYSTTHRLLERAGRQQVATSEDKLLLTQSERLLQLNPAPNLPVRERVDRILAARTIARQRLTTCLAATGSLRLPPGSLQTRWTGSEATSNRSTLLRDPDGQAATLQLIYDTELATEQAARTTPAHEGSSACPAPTGDDAVLLLLAKSSHLEELNRP